MVVLMLTKPLVSASLLFAIPGNWDKSLDFSQKYVMIVLIKIIIVVTLKCFLKNVCINNAKMLYYNRIDLYEGTDVSKTSVSKEWIINTIAIFGCSV